MIGRKICLTISLCSSGDSWSGSHIEVPPRRKRACCGDRGLAFAVPNANGHGTAYYTISTQGLEFLTALRKDKPAEKMKAATGSAMIEILKLLAAAIVGAIAAKLSGYLHWP